MLRIDLREVRAGPVETTGQIAADDPLFADVEVVLARPVGVSGHITQAGERKFFWRAQIDTVARGECRRCLAPVDIVVSRALELVLAASDEAPDDEGCYTYASRTTVLDLRDAVREELVLALPQFVECRSDCRGLCPHCGANLNAGPCGCRAPSDPRWGTLRALVPDGPKTD